MKVGPPTPYVHCRFQKCCEGLLARSEIHNIYEQRYVAHYGKDGFDLIEPYMEEEDYYFSYQIVKLKCTMLPVRSTMFVIIPLQIHLVVINAMVVTLCLLPAVNQSANLG